MLDVAVQKQEITVTKLGDEPERKSIGMWSLRTNWDNTDSTKWHDSFACSKVPSERSKYILVKSTSLLSFPLKIRLITKVRERLD